MIGTYIASVLVVLLADYTSSLFSPLLLSCVHLEGAYASYYLRADIETSVRDALAWVEGRCEGKYSCEEAGNTVILSLIEQWNRVSGVSLSTCERPVVYIEGRGLVLACPIAGSAGRAYVYIPPGFD